MTVHTYSGSTLTANVTRDTTPAGTFSAMSCKRSVGAPILFSSFVCDIRSAGDYELRIDGVTVASVAGVAAAATAVAFTPASPIELLPGDGGEADGGYLFSLVCTSGSVLWYGRGNLGGSGYPSGVDGTGRPYTQQDYWHELNTGVCVPGQLNFKLADVALDSTLLFDSLSSGSFSGQTTTVTFDVDVILLGVRKRLFASDTWALNIDGSPAASFVKDANALTIDGHFGIPANGLRLAAGAHTFNIDPTANRRMYYDSGTGGSPSGTGSAHTTGYSVWAESTGNKVDMAIFFRLALEDPTSLTANATDPFTVELDWAAPASGPTPAGYQYRVDGGSPVDAGNVLTATVGSLTPETTYEFEVRAYLEGTFSDWVSVEETTPADEEPLPEGVYRVTLEIGDAGENSFDVTSGDEAGYGVLLPLSVGWEIPESERVLPVQTGPCVLAFSILVPEAQSELIDVLAPGVRVSFRMYVTDPSDPWQAFDGNVTQVNGQHVRRNKTEWDWRVDVFASDVAGLDRPVGFNDEDWPIEDLAARLERITNELGIRDWLPDELSDSNNLGGSPIAIDPTLVLDDTTVSAHEMSEGSVSALSHIRTILRWACAENAPDEFFGDQFFRWLFGYDPTLRDSAGDIDLIAGIPTLRLYLSGVIDSLGQTIELDGDHVTTDPRWFKLLPNRRPNWGVIDEELHGIPDNLEGIRISTPYGDPEPGLNEDYGLNLAGFLFTYDWEEAEGHGWTALDGWRTKQVRHLSYLDPEPVRMLIVGDGVPQNFPIRPLVIDNLTEELQIDDAGTILGTLAGVKLIIPPGGDYFLELKLRPELPPLLPPAGP